MWLSNLRLFEKISYNKNQLSVFSPFLFFNRQTFDRFMFVRFHRIQKQFQNSATSEPIITFLSTNRTWNIDGKKKGIKKWVGEISEEFEIKIRTRHIRVHTFVRLYVPFEYLWRRKFRAIRTHYTDVDAHDGYAHMYKGILGNGGGTEKENASEEREHGNRANRSILKRWKEKNHDLSSYLRDKFRFPRVRFLEIFFATWKHFRCFLGAKRQRG